MPTYIYETIPSKVGAKPKRFEIFQSMKDDALTKHPETGEPVRRVITGGYGFIGSGDGGSVPVPSQGHSHKGGGCCGGACGCGHH